ncbi:hypothetical protein BGW80DRAFT_1471900 [Lactifluus volemus]|nr:hypothetical protein BGW80DRAFT_1471900 [Lactifluus volemus]
MSSSFKLTIAQDIRLDELPSDQVALAAARELLESTKDWKKGKAYQNTVQTCSRPKSTGDGAGWHCRVSEHSPEEATFDELWKEYINDVKKVTLIKKISATQEIWSAYYEFSSFVVSPRVFTVLQIVHCESTSPRTGIFISIPVDLSSDPELANLEEKGVKGRYVSVERITELPNGKTEWRMATSSSPGGRIPALVVDKTMPGTISADVPHFFKWFQTVRNATETKEGLPTATTGGINTVAATTA